ncbi:RNA polymerase sigma factor, partial [Arthrospira platensis SPKY1]|nr:RNA polymerase sigma factor [Arthrospira platensis SPKY1]
MYKIVLHQCHEERRRAKSRGFMHWLSFQSDKVKDLDEPSLQNHLAGMEEQPDHPLLQAERTRLLEQAMGQLRDELKTVVVLKHYENLKFREIADILDISENTVKTRLYTALKQLQ